ncbi:unnamed protein product, partial [Ostreobium quekettii]
DSGGPALIPDVLHGSYEWGRPALDLIVGVTSGGNGLRDDEKMESVYTRVSELQSWVLSVIE